MDNDIKVLTKDEITKKDRESLKLQYEEIEGYGWFAFKPLTQKVRDDFDADLIKNSKGTGENAQVDIRGMKSKAISLVVVDGETAEPMFSVEEASELSATLSSKLWEKTASLCGLSDMAVKELAKNS